MKIEGRVTGVPNRPDKVYGVMKFFENGTILIVELDTGQNIEVIPLSPLMIFDLDGIDLAKENKKGMDEAAEKLTRGMSRKGKRGGGKEETSEVEAAQT